jgi:hypothetical protein
VPKHNLNGSMMPYVEEAGLTLGHDDFVLIVEREP